MIDRLHNRLPVRRINPPPITGFAGIRQVIESLVVIGMIAVRRAVTVDGRPGFVHERARVRIDSNAAHCFYQIHPISLVEASAANLGQVLQVELEATLDQAPAELSATYCQVPAANLDPVVAEESGQSDGWPLAVESESVARFPVEE